MVIAGPAAARSLRFSTTDFRETWRTISFIMGGSTVECELILEGRFHNTTVNKVLNALIGRVTRAMVANCVGGTANVMAETLPWHIKYGGFTGTLPRITGIRRTIIGVSISLNPGFGTCVYRTSATNPAATIWSVEAGGGLTSSRFDETLEIPSESGGICAFTKKRVAGTTTTLTVLGTNNRITVTLI
jgi:hypothetical protein